MDFSLFSLIKHFQSYNFSLFIVHNLRLSPYLLKLSGLLKSPSTSDQAWFTDMSPERTEEIKESFRQASRGIIVFESQVPKLVLCTMILAFNIEHQNKFIFFRSKNPTSGHGLQRSAAKQQPLRRLRAQRLNKRERTISFVFNLDNCSGCWRFLLSENTIFRLIWLYNPFTF